MISNLLQSPKIPAQDMREISENFRILKTMMETQNHNILAIKIAIANDQPAEAIHALRCCEENEKEILNLYNDVVLLMGVAAK